MKTYRTKNPQKPLNPRWFSWELRPRPVPEYEEKKR